MTGCGESSCVRITQLAERSQRNVDTTRESPSSTVRKLRNLWRCQRGREDGGVDLLAHAFAASTRRPGSTPAGVERNRAYASQSASSVRSMTSTCTRSGRPACRAISTQRGSVLARSDPPVPPLKIQRSVTRRASA